jgi:hypothetical protein
MLENEDREHEVDQEDGNETVIQDTDIVFDCPYCNHNLAIDFRGAGLQTNCVNCGQSVLVPIPDGMEIADLDLDEREILKLLFATRRNLKTAMIRINELQETLDIELERKAHLESLSAKYVVQLEELSNLCKQQTTVNEKFSLMVQRALHSMTSKEEEAKSEKE